MEIDNIRDQVDRSSLATFETLLASTLRTPLEENEHLDYFTMIKDSCVWLIDKTEPDLESAHGIIEVLKGNWDETSFLEYVKVQDHAQYEYLKTVDNVNVEMYGLVVGIRAAIHYFSELIELLISGKKLDDIYVGFDTPGEFLRMNSDDLDYSRTSILTDLILQLNSELSNGFSDSERLKSMEKIEFETLFHPSGAAHDWTYLSERLGIEPDDVAELYKLRKHVDNGQYVTTFYSFDRDRRLNYAFLLAIRDYLTFLDSGETPLNANVSTDEIDPEFTNLALRQEFQKNLEVAYSLLKDEFIQCDYETFRGIFVPGTFNGKVKISIHATVAELKLLLEKIKDYINAYSKRWKHASMLFELADGTPLTKNSFNTAKLNSVAHTREAQIVKIAEEIIKK